MTIDDLHPRPVWHYFKALTQIPRPSYHEEAVRQYVLDEAARLGLESDMDDVGNILVRKPASAGKEQIPGVVLQAHLDMVPQKNNDKQHDFTTDPIETIVKGEWLTANGTTLGADNGIGAAAALAILADNTFEHGPIEALFTATEERGMDGAKGLREHWLVGDILLNLDSEDEGELYIGCAGGVDTTLRLPLTYQSATSGKTYALHLSGLAGGHSGLNIIDQRGNANVLLAQLLDALASDNTLSLVAFSGGNMRNAIPREAHAVVLYNGEADALVQKLEPIVAQLRESLGEIDQGFNVRCEAHEQADEVLTANSTKQLLSAIMLSPNGVLRMSHDMPGLVETSANLAIAELEDHTLVLHSLLRSANDEAKADVMRRMVLLADVLGAKMVFSGNYSGWQPNPNAPVVQLMQQTGKEIFQQTPPLKAIHAGLECGILGEHYPHWQMVSFGPTITGAHSPDEQVYIPSVDTFWQWLVLSLKRIAQL